MATLTQLPPEILHNILRFVDPEDLQAVPWVCRQLYRFTFENAPLYRDIYYRVLDDPPTDDLHWEKELRDFVKLQNICNRHGVDKTAHLPFVYDTVTRLLKNAACDGIRGCRSATHAHSLNAETLTKLFQEDENQDAFLSRSFIFDRARGETNRFTDPPKVEYQQSAKLHSLYGVSMLKHGRTRSSRMYPFACSKVYDLRQYTEATKWGPFMSDGSIRVDWEKVEAILIVLRSNLKNRGYDKLPLLGSFWNTPFAGPWSNSYLPWPPTRELTPLELKDPYDVSGTWVRVVCFLDYNDFFSYNFPMGDEIPENVPRPVLDTGEATRLILMKINVTAVEQPSPEDDPNMPLVRFEGYSYSLDRSRDENANSALRGWVRTTPEGEVRWTTVSVFSGQDRWRSEGIQVGGIRSARGVVGNWFDNDYDPHGPCGPTAFWKMTDPRPKTDDRHALLNDFLPIVDDFEEEDDENDSDYEAELYVDIDMTDDIEIDSDEVEELIQADVAYMEALDEQFGGHS